MSIEEMGRVDIRPISEDEAQKLPDSIHYKWAVWLPDGQQVGGGYVRDSGEAYTVVDWVLARLEVDGHL